MYVKVDCPVCKNADWVDIKLNISESTISRNEEEVYLLSLNGVEVFDVITEDEMINRVRTQFLKKNEYYSKDRLEKMFTEYMGISPKYTHDLTWRLKAPTIKKTIFIKIIDRAIWLLQGIEADDNLIYFIVGACATGILSIIWPMAG